MDPLVIACFLVAIGAVAYAAYQWAKRWRIEGESDLQISDVERDIEYALKYFDDWADKHWGPGELPDHVKQLRDRIAKVSDTAGSWWN